MRSVFVLQHLHLSSDADEDHKFIGVYSSRDQARHAVERLRLLPGFRDFPVLVADLDEGPGEGSGFYLSEHVLDSDAWSSGFETV